jgi:hypothetical protein
MKRISTATVREKQPLETTLCEAAGVEAKGKKKPYPGRGELQE